MPYHGPFHFDVATALVGQLVAEFNGLTLARLTAANVAALPTGKGVYELHYANSLVYVGKAEAGLRNRLGDHLYKLSGRTKINMADMKFRGLTVPASWVTFAPEGLLINHHQANGACTWNTSGFGNNDPGRERDTQEPSKFNTTFPINASWPCHAVPAGVISALQLVKAIKKELPFLLRFENGHPDFTGKNVNVPKAGMAARDLLKIVVTAMPGWQATEFPGHLILYKESKVYMWGTVI